MKKPVPFDFVMEKLLPLNPVVRSMFGCHAVYIASKIVLVLRHRKDHTPDNGVWIATQKKHHASLQLEFPSMRSIQLLGQEPTNWQIIPSKSDDFEESVLRVCDLIKKNDFRIGNSPSHSKSLKK